jgi:hypothetical protein
MLGYVRSGCVARKRRLSVQCDEETACSGHFIAYVLYVEDTTINKHMLSGNL